MHAFEDEKTSDSLDAQGASFEAQGRWAEAAQYHKRALAVRERLLGPCMKTAQSCLHVSLCLSRHGHHKEALPYCERAELWIRANPTQVEPEVTHTVRILRGQILRGTGQFNEAAALLRELSQTQTDDLLRSEAWNNLAGVYRDMAKYDDALALYSQVYDSATKRKGEGSQEALTVLNNIALTLSDSNAQPELVLKNLQKVYDGYLKLGGEEHVNTIKTASSISIALQGMGRYEEAETWARKAFRASERVFGEENQPTLSIANTLGIVLTQLKKYDEAEDVLEACLSGLTHVYGPSHFMTLTTRANLAGALHGKGDLEKSLTEQSIAYEGVKKGLGAGHPAARKSIQEIIRIQHEMGRYSDAIKNQEALLDTMLQQPPHHSGHVLCMEKLALFYRKNGETTKAEATADRAKKLGDRIRSGR
jgi:tetratricopeptide (TPR) repeat protein